MCFGVNILLLLLIVSHDFIKTEARGDQDNDSSELEERKDKKVNRSLEKSDEDVSEEYSRRYYLNRYPMTPIRAVTNRINSRVSHIPGVNVRRSLLGDYLNREYGGPQQSYPDLRQGNSFNGPNYGQNVAYGGPQPSYPDVRQGNSFSGPNYGQNVAYGGPQPSYPDVRQGNAFGGQNFGQGYPGLVSPKDARDYGNFDSNGQKPPQQVYPMPGSYGPNQDLTGVMRTPAFNPNNQGEGNEPTPYGPIHTRNSNNYGVHTYSNANTGNNVAGAAPIDYTDNRLGNQDPNSRNAGQEINDQLDVPFRGTNKISEYDLFKAKLENLKPQSRTNKGMLIDERQRQEIDQQMEILQKKIENDDNLRSQHEIRQQNMERARSYPMPQNFVPRYQDPQNPPQYYPQPKYPVRQNNPPSNFVTQYPVAGVPNLYTQNAIPQNLAPYYPRPRNLVPQNRMSPYPSQPQQQNKELPYSETHNPVPVIPDPQQPRPPNTNTEDQNLDDSVPDNPILTNQNPLNPTPDPHPNNPGSYDLDPNSQGYSNPDLINPNLHKSPQSDLNPNNTDYSNPLTYNPNQNYPVPTNKPDTNSPNNPESDNIEPRDHLNPNNTTDSIDPPPDPDPSSQVTDSNNQEPYDPGSNNSTSNNPDLNNAVLINPDLNNPVSVPSTPDPVPVTPVPNNSDQINATSSNIVPSQEPGLTESEPATLGTIGIEMFPNEPDYDLIPGWHELGVPGLTQLQTGTPVTTVTEAPAITDIHLDHTSLASLGANSTGMDSVTPLLVHQVVVETKAMMKDQSMGYLAGFCSKLLEILEYKQHPEVEELVGGLHSVTHSMIAKGEFDEFGNATIKAIDFVTRTLNAYGVFIVNKPQLRHTRKMIRYRVVYFDDDVLKAFDIMDASYTIEEGDKLLQTLVDVSNFPINYLSTFEVNTRIINALLQPFRRTAGTESRKKLIKMVNRILVERYDLREPLISRIKPAGRQVGETVHKINFTNTKDKSINASENFTANARRRAQDDFIYNEENKFSSIMNNLLKSYRIIRNSGHKVEIDKRYKTSEGIDRGSFRKIKVNPRKLKRDKNRNYKSPKSKGFKKEDIMHNNVHKKKRKHNIKETRGLKTARHRQERLNQGGFNYEKSLRNRLFEKNRYVNPRGILNSRKVKKASPVLKNKFNVIKEGLIKSSDAKINKDGNSNKENNIKPTANISYRDRDSKVAKDQKRFNVVKTNQILKKNKTLNNKLLENLLRYNKNEYVPQQPNELPEHIVKSRYLDQIFRKRLNFKQAMGYTKKIETKENKNRILQNIIEESRYSDDEKELKFVLSDAIRHSDFVLRNFRNNEIIKEKKKLHEQSSYSDEEGLIKNNIYKVFGYDPDLDIKI